MISQTGGVAVRSAYTANFTEGKEAAQKAAANVSKQGDVSKVDRIKEALESGEYKVNLEALSKKIAEELM